MPALRDAVGELMTGLVATAFAAARWINPISIPRRARGWIVSRAFARQRRYDLHCSTCKGDLHRRGCSGGGTAERSTTGHDRKKRPGARCHTPGPLPSHTTTAGSRGHDARAPYRGWVPEVPEWAAAEWAGPSSGP